MANTATAVLNEAGKHVGVSGRPNAFTRDYASRHGDAFLRAAWCDMFVTYTARKAGAAKAVLPSGDRAYTPWHAADFKEMDRAYPGTVANVKEHAKPGCVLFFDWNGSNDIPDVDHVGYVVKNLGDGRVITLEGNTGDAVKYRVRGADVIAVICVPKYDTEKPPVIRPISTYPYRAGTFMRKGWMNSRGVERVQGALNALGYSPKLLVDGDFGEKTRRGVLWFQRRNGLAQDGIVGPKTWAKLFPARA